jgi:hypothetical protein
VRQNIAPRDGSERLVAFPPQRAGIAASSSDQSNFSDCPAADGAPKLAIQSKF